MPEDRDDPIADTGMFRAFVAKGEPEMVQRNRLGRMTLIIGVLLVLLVTALLVWILAS